MKKALFAVIILASYCSYGQTKKPLTDEAKLNKCISENTAFFLFSGQKPEGRGWDILQGLFADNQFVAWGEYHNSPLLSQLTCFALEGASENGFKTWCTETSPFAASELSRFSKTKNPYEAILSTSKETNISPTFPFFASEEDAQMLKTAGRLNYRIWGIDQEFQMTFPYCINTIYNNVPAPLKPRYKPVKDSLLVKWWMPDAKLLDSLGKVIKAPALKNLIAEIGISKSIYNSDDGSQLRAKLMKHNFYTSFDALKSKNEKVFFKMGNNHLARGMNLETKIYDIGNAVFEIAEHNRTGFANVYFMVRYSTDKGKIIDDLESEQNENPKVFSKLYDKEKWILADIRSLRRRIKYDGSLSSDTYRLIEKYDYVVISPEVL
ncbi:MAG: hypothetical protein V4543_09390 [Bacteroidota bacterium]